MKVSISIFLVLFLGFTMIGCMREKLPELEPGECIEGQSYTYDTNIRFIIVQKCSDGSTCHNHESASTPFTEFESLEPTLNGNPNQFEDRVFVRRDMPPSNHDVQLTQQDLNLLLCWMEAGYPEN